MNEKLKKELLHRSWMKVISLLAGVVVFCTTYALILPAITMSSQQANCGLEEHEHTEECFDAERNLICGLDEHIHTLTCYADLKADIENEEIWKQETPDLTADRGADVAAIAGSLVGYRESDRNYLVSEEEETKGYTRFGHWYGEMIDKELAVRAEKAKLDPPEKMEVKTAFAEELRDSHVVRIENRLPAYSYLDWNAMFVSYVLHYAQIPEFGYDTDAGNWAGALAASGKYVEAAGYIPSVGDLVFFTPKVGDKVQVGIVSGINREMMGLGANVSTISVILGDCDNAVREIKLAYGDGSGDQTTGTINGYGVLTPKSAEEIAAENESAASSIVDFITGIFRPQEPSEEPMDEAVAGDAANNEAVSAEQTEEGSGAEEDEAEVRLSDKEDASAAADMTGKKEDKENPAVDKADGKEGKADPAADKSGEKTAEGKENPSVKADETAEGKADPSVKADKAAEDGKKTEAGAGTPSDTEPAGDSKDEEKSGDAASDNVKAEPGSTVKLVQADVIEDENILVMKWSVAAHLPDNTLPEGAVINIDTNTGRSHGMTVSQAKKWGGSVKIGGRKASFAETDSFETALIGSDGMIYTWEKLQEMDDDASVTFAGIQVKALAGEELADEDHLLSFNYETAADLTKAGSGTNYYLIKTAVAGYAGSASYVYENEDAAGEEVEGVFKDAVTDKKDGSKSDKTDAGRADETSGGKEAKSKEENKDKGKKEQTKKLTVSRSGYKITLSYTAKAQIPTGAKLDALEIKEDAAEYASYVRRAGEALGLEQNDENAIAGRFFDIRIVTSDGEIEPKAPVTVKIEYKKPMDTDNVSGVSAVRFDEEEGAAAVDASASEKEGEIRTAEFKAESFGVYGIVYRVDHHWDVDGKKYEYSLPDGGYAGLEAVVKELGLADKAAGDAEAEETGSKDELTAEEAAETGADDQVGAADSAGGSDAAAKFVAGVRSVSSSNPDLVWVGKNESDATVGALKDENDLEVEYAAELTKKQIKNTEAQTVKAGDWALIGMAPFMSEETLTVAMKNGEVFEVKVTDTQISKIISTADNQSWEITVTYGCDAQIPEGAKLAVTEILPEDEAYSDYYARAKEVALQDAKAQGMEDPFVLGQYIFDIEIRGGEGKIEPAAPVHVNIRLLGTMTDSLSVVHFGESGPASMELQETAEDALKSARGGAEDENTVSAYDVSFETDAFSVYNVVNMSDIANSNGNYGYALVSKNGPGYYAATQGGGSTNSDIFNYAMTANESSQEYDGVRTLAGKVVERTDQGNERKIGGEVAEWYFEKVDNTKYRIYTKDSENHIKYLTSTANGNRQALVLTNQAPDTSSEWFEISDAGNDYIRIKVRNSSHQSDDWYISNGGGNPSYYYVQGGQDDGTLFRLAKRDPNYDEHVAKKVSAADYRSDNAAKNWTINEGVIIYRKFVDQNDNEHLYALKSDGTFVPVYDGGDSIYYHSADASELLWDIGFDPGADQGFYIKARNGNTYLAPGNTESGGEGWKSSSKKYLTVNGIDNDYGSKIEVWNQAAYAYIGLNMDENNPGNSVNSGVNGDTFYFATVGTLSVNGDQPHPVDTVDSTAMGINMTIFNYGGDTYHFGYRNRMMQDIMGDDMRDDWDNRKSHVTETVKGALNQDGWPVGLSNSDNGNNGSYERLFTPGANINGQTVEGYPANHLFLQSYYDETGMFRYSSMENHAYFDRGGQVNADGTRDFTVYREAATPNIPTQSDHYYFYHGHFMPFNDINMNQDVSRLVNQYGWMTNPDEGRSYENVYGLNGTPDYYHGLMMEANFVQPHNGTLANGDPVVFKFTGDDDLLVYIDGVLVLDVGGIHEPLSGSIDFKTGVVVQPNYYNQGEGWGHKTTTLREIFERAYNNGLISEEKYRSIQWEGNTFKDFTTHEFKMFYMERGAGASNLDLQFNLQTVKTNEFMVEKQLSDDVNPQYGAQTYRYRAVYDSDGNGTMLPIAIDNVICVGVDRYASRADANSRHNPTPLTNADLTNGYFTLKAGEVVIFKMKNESTVYDVFEVGIDEDEIRRVDINNVQEPIVSSAGIAGVSGESGVDKVAQAHPSEVMNRPSVVYRNYPYPQNLRITKHIYTQDTVVPAGITAVGNPGAAPSDGENPLFEFRVYIESAAEGKLVPYAYGDYYLVKTIGGKDHYFVYNETTGGYDDSGTTPAVCTTSGRNGLINNIPPEYTLVIPDLAVGTNFYVVEREVTIPEGYQFAFSGLAEDTYENRDSKYQTFTNDVNIRRGTGDSHEFDYRVTGKLVKDAAADSHFYNKKPIANVPVRKMWSPTGVIPESATLSLVRYRTPENKTPAAGNGAITIKHQGIYNDLVSVPHKTVNGAVPEEFVMKYTIKDASSGEVVLETTKTGQINLPAGNYRVEASVVQVKEPENYVYDSTTPYDSGQSVIAVDDVVVTTGNVTEVDFTSTFNYEKSGKLVIDHRGIPVPSDGDFDGVYNESEFSAVYTVTKLLGSGQRRRVLTDVPAGEYVLSPGNYEITVKVTDPAEPEGYAYIKTYGEDPANPGASRPDGTPALVSVQSDDVTTAPFVSEYEKNGIVQITHTADRLHDVTTLPADFEATYTLSNAERTYTFDYPVTSASVAPGTYTLSVEVKNPGTTSGEHYVSTSVTNPSTAEITVPSGGTATADVLSRYEKDLERFTIQLNEKFTRTGQPEAASPAGFNAVYVLENVSTHDRITVNENEPITILEGTYTVTPVIYNSGKYEVGNTTYVYDRTTPSSITVTGNQTYDITHDYCVGRELTIEHVSQGLPTSPDLPDNFGATYKITGENSGLVYYADAPGTIYVKPDNYTVTVDRYDSEGDVPEYFTRSDAAISDTVNLTSAGSGTAHLVSQYNTPEGMTVIAFVGIPLKFNNISINGNSDGSATGKTSQNYAVIAPYNSSVQFGIDGWNNVSPDSPVGGGSLAPVLYSVGTSSDPSQFGSGTLNSNSGGSISISDTGQEGLVIVNIHRNTKTDLDYVVDYAMYPGHPIVNWSDYDEINTDTYWTVTYSGNLQWKLMYDDGNNWQDVTENNQVVRGGSGDSFHIGYYDHYVLHFEGNPSNQNTIDESIQLTPAAGPTAVPGGSNGLNGNNGSLQTMSVSGASTRNAAALNNSLVNRVIGNADGTSLDGSEDGTSLVGSEDGLDGTNLADKILAQTDASNQKTDGSGDAGSELAGNIKAALRGTAYGMNAVYADDLDRDGLAAGDLGVNDSLKGGAVRGLKSGGDQSFRATATPESPVVVKPLELTIPVDKKPYTDLPASYKGMLDPMFGMSITLNGSETPDPWNYVFQNLPANDSNGMPYYYMMIETPVPDGFEETYSHDPQQADAINNPLNVTNRKNAGDLELDKEVTGTGANLSKEFTFTVTLEAPVGGTLAASYKCEQTGTAGEFDQAITWAAGKEGQKGTIVVTLKHGESWKIKNLPVDAKYTIEENDYSSEGYTGSLANGSDSETGLIRATTVSTPSRHVSYVNSYQPATIEAHATKEWSFGGTAVSYWPEDVDHVVFALYAKVGTSGSYLPISDSSISAYFTGIEATKNVTKNDDVKRADWSNLPTYVNVSGTPQEVTYAVKETQIVYTVASGITPQTKTLDTPIGATANVITNEIPPTSIEVTKAWQQQGYYTSSANRNTPPAGASVTFTLYRNGDVMTGRTVVLDGTADAANANGDCEKTAWVAHFGNLPKYDPEGHKYTYTVVETGTWTGYYTNESGMIPDSSTITNRETVLNLDILKRDKDSKTPIQGAVFTLNKINGSDGSIIGGTTQTKTTDEFGKTSFEDLPVGYYVIEETSVPKGYVITGEGKFYIKVAESVSGMQTVTNIVLLDKVDNKTPQEWTAVTSYGIVSNFTEKSGQIDAEATVDNEKGAALPSTGGCGTAMMQLLGLILAAAGCFGILIRKRADVTG